MKRLVDQNPHKSKAYHKWRGNKKTEGLMTKNPH